MRAKASIDSITIRWDPPSTMKEILVRGYTLSYGIETSSQKIVIEGANTNIFTITGLSKDF